MAMQGSRPGCISLRRICATVLMLGCLAWGPAGCASVFGPRAQPPSAANAASNDVYVSEIGRGQFDCFAPGTAREDAPSDTAFCETSAVVRFAKQVWVASDKALPQKNGAAIFALTVGPSEIDIDRIPNSEMQEPPFSRLRKVEAMAFSASDNWAFASTGFDRVDDNKPQWDRYNTLLAWPADKPQNAHVVAASTRDDAESSVRLRRAFQRAMADADWPQGPPYFKVEGLAALPGQRLLFGVREAGASYQDFSYQIRLIEATYSIQDDRVAIDEESFRLVLDAGPKTVDGHRVAVSSLLYDATRDWLWMLTSFEEEGGGLGAYLMVAAAPDFHQESAWRFVKSAAAPTPFVFANKAEGMAFVEDDALLVVFDEDRRVNDGPTSDFPTQVARAPHQGAFMLLRVRSGAP